MKWGRAIGWTAALALPGFVGLSSFVVVNQVRVPARALVIGVEPTGVAQGRMAFDLYRRALGADRNAKVKAGWENMARRSYAAEPLETGSLGLIAAAWADKPDAKRLALLHAVGKLNRRDGLVAAQLIQLAATTGDRNTAFRWMAHTIETDAAARGDYVRAMAEVTAQDGAVNALLPLIGPRPSWTDQYWQHVIGRPNSLANAAALRGALAREPWNQHEIEDSERALIGALVSRQQMGEAQQLAQALGQPIPSLRNDGNLVFNGDFAHSPRLPPFDWSLAATGALAASIDTGGKALAMSAIGGAQTHAARQLIWVEPGVYRLGWTLTSDAASAPPIFATLRCAESRAAEGGDFVRLPMKTGKASMRLRVPDGDCRWRWLAINVATDDAAMGFDAALRNISLVRGVRASDQAAEEGE